MGQFVRHGLVDGLAHHRLHLFAQAHDDGSRLLLHHRGDGIAQALADVSQLLSVAFMPQFDDGVLDRIELVSLNDNRLLVVLELRAGPVDTVTLALRQPVRQDLLAETAQALNERLKSQHQSKVYHLAVEEASAAGPLVATFKARPKPHVEVWIRGCLTCKEPMLQKEGGNISRGRFFTLKLPRDIKIGRGKGSLYNLTHIGLVRFDGV